MIAAPKTHSAVLIGGDVWHCPRCSSERVKIHADKVTSLGVVKKQMQCRACGGYFLVSTKAFEKYKEVKHKHLQ